MPTPLHLLQRLTGRRAAYLSIAVRWEKRVRVQFLVHEWLGAPHQILCDFYDFLNNSARITKHTYDPAEWGELQCISQAASWSTVWQRFTCCISGARTGKRTDCKREYSTQLHSAEEGCSVFHDNRWCDARTTSGRNTDAVGFKTKPA